MDKLASRVCHCSNIYGFIWEGVIDFNLVERTEPRSQINIIKLNYYLSSIQ